MSWPAPGRIADGKFTRAFGSLVTGHFSGALRLELPGEDRAHAIFWNDGVIVDADSRSPEDTLGRVALDAGLIDNGQLSEAIRRQASHPERSQRQIFEEMNALPAESLERAARLTLTRRALRAFAMPAATFSVSEESHSRAEGGPVEPRWTLYRGLRLHYDEHRLGLELGDLTDRAMKLGPEQAEIVDRFGFSDEERILLAYLQKGYWELEDLAEACLTMPRNVVLAAVAALRAVDALDVQKAGSVPRLRKRAREQTLQMGRDALKPLQAAQLGRPSGSQTVVPVRSGTLPPVPAKAPSGTQPPAPSSTNPAARSGTYPPVSSATHPPAPTKPLPAASSPPASSSRPNPSAAARPSVTQPMVVPPRPSSSQPSVAARPGTLPPSSSSSLSSSSGNIPVVTAPAMTKVLREQIVHKLAQVDGGADHFAVLEIGRDVSSGQVKAAYFHLAKTYHPDRLALVQLESMRPQVERIFARLSDAYAGLVDDARRKEYLQILSQGGEAAVKRRNDDEVAAATKLLTAEEHFRKGEMALRRKMWSAAIDEFQAAVDLNDLEAEHHACLAWAKWCAAENKDDKLFVEVKKGLNRAMELSDRCLPAYFFMGHVYIARHELDRAFNMFQRVLNINENHVDAKREVRVLEMRRAKASEKKGLFDMFKKK